MKSIFAVQSTISAFVIAMLFGPVSTGSAQSRIHYNNQDLFLSGSNVAWVNFAGDLGPGPLDSVRFRTAFDSIHANGGNSFRLWLYTNGTQSPDFNGNGMVIGPGGKAQAYLRKILDMAWQRKIGLMLCLWSFDMLRASIGSFYTTRNSLMLTDTAYTMAFINNALIPLVNSVRGHPAILSWEVFNEAEGMTNEYGWADILHVPIAAIQRFVNLTAGAIHRTDRTAKVTTGAWAMTVETDAVLPAKGLDLQTRLATMTEAEKKRIEHEFTARYAINMSAAQILAPLAVQAVNYYRDDRLIATGGDPDGTLDFYTDHYYDWQGTPLSPFHHPCSTWQLTKPLVIAEFFPEQTLTLPYNVLYQTLYDGGYAGAMTWGWYSGASGHPQETLEANTLVLIADLFSRYAEQIALTIVPGTIYTFSAQPALIDSGETSVLDWKTAAGTATLLNGTPVSSWGTQTVTPDTTTTYTLETTGAVNDTSTTSVSIYRSGKIIGFRSSAVLIGSGDRVTLRWKVAHGSTVALNDAMVGRVDSLTVHPGTTTIYMLTTEGAVKDTASITVNVIPADQFNRALSRPVTVSSTSTNPGYSGPQSIVDGDTLSQWMSGPANNQWVICDLGQDLVLRRVVVNWGWNYATAYRLDLGPDGLAWDSINGTSSGMGGITTFDSLNIRARYLRVWLTARWNVVAGGFVIRELLAYGDQYPVSAATNRPVVPDRFGLRQNYPNPFNSVSNIEFQIANSGPVKLVVYDLLGRQVSTLVNEVKLAGIYTVQFDGNGLSSGVYFYRLVAGGFVQTKSLMLLK